jgi:hypothetical protein
MKKLFLVLISLTSLSAHGMMSAPFKGLAQGLHWVGKNFRTAGKWANIAGKKVGKTERKVIKQTAKVVNPYAVQAAQSSARFKEAMASYFLAMQATGFKKLADGFEAFQPRLNAGKLFARTSYDATQRILYGPKKPTALAIPTQKTKALVKYVG